MVDQIIVFAVLAAALVMFVGGWIRYDLTAMLALLVLTVLGVVEADQAFTGFAHPAVVTVAAVLVASAGLQHAGVVEIIGDWLGTRVRGMTLQVAVLCGLVTVFSSFMNNIGALALLMPVAIQLARRANRSASFLLMPMAFASLLGGMMTLIGTPPNIIIATVRAENGQARFGMFDFAPVGIAVALAGWAFIALVGWRLVPRRDAGTGKEDLFEIADYVTELIVSADSKVRGTSIRDWEKDDDLDAQVLCIVRDGRRIWTPSVYERFMTDDRLIVEASPETIKSMIDNQGLVLEAQDKQSGDLLKSDDVGVVEAIVTAEGLLSGQTVGRLGLRHRFGINLLAIARAGRRITRQIRDVKLQPGDIVLLQGELKAMPEQLRELGALPLAERGLRIGKPRRVVPAIALFLAAIVVATLGWMPIELAFTAAAVGMLLTRLLPLRELYTAIDWPVVVLLGAMMPVGAALETTGGARLIGETIASLCGGAAPWVAVAILATAAMLLSNLINNAAAALLMGPIGISLAAAMNVSADPMLMAVAVAASAAFLTPIGHQSNLLVMTPGGYRFADYWRLGLPLSLLVLIVAIPVVLLVWPLAK
jgi:di/tricarboxylate transporter